jgi:hypothetical protein
MGILVIALPALNPGKDKLRIQAMAFLSKQIKRLRLRPWSLLALLAPTLVHAQVVLRFEEGIARNPESQVELYREQHWLRSEGDHLTERLVLYRCPDGTAFARKRLDYRASALAPQFRFEDSRLGYVEGLRQGPAPQLFVRPDAKAAERSAPVSRNRLVADAGFDEFIRLSWPALVNGQAVPLAFAIPSRLESLDFTVRLAGETRIQGEQAWVFRLRLGGWLGWLAPHIDVTYSQSSRRLLRFEGLSNLRDNTGENPLLAQIVFATPARLASEAQWQATLQAPLSACRTGH